MVAKRLCLHLKRISKSHNSKFTPFIPLSALDCVIEHKACHHSADYLSISKRLFTHTRQEAEVAHLPSCPRRGWLVFRQRCAITSPDLTTPETQLETVRAVSAPLSLSELDFCFHGPQLRPGNRRRCRGVDDVDRGPAR